MNTDIETLVIIRLRNLFGKILAIGLAFFMFCATAHYCSKPKPAPVKKTTKTQYC